MSAAPTEAIGAEAEALFQRVIGEVRRINSSSEGEFNRYCKAFGTCAPPLTDKALEYASFLHKTYGDGFLRDFVPLLVRLISDADKREELLVQARTLVPTGIFSGSTSGAVATNEADAPIQSGLSAGGATSWEQVLQILEEQALNLWDDESSGGKIGQQKRDMADILVRVSNYLSGLCQSGESVLKAWHVTSINEWGVRQERVLLLTNLSYFRVKFDRASQKITKHVRIAMNEVTKVALEGLSTMVVLSSAQDGRLGAVRGTSWLFAKVKKDENADELQQSRKEYEVVHPSDCDSTSEGARAVMTQLIWAFTAIHQICAPAQGA
jgi:hypothetical protein